MDFIDYFYLYFYDLQLNLLYVTILLDFLNKTFYQASCSIDNN